jgi:hypothetical protein
MSPEDVGAPPENAAADEAPEDRAEGARNAPAARRCRPATEADLSVAAYLIPGNDLRPRQGRLPSLNEKILTHYARATGQGQPALCVVSPKLARLRQDVLLALKVRAKHALRVGQGRRRSSPAGGAGLRRRARRSMRPASSSSSATTPTRSTPPSASSQAGAPRGLSPAAVG